jgi:hypothetical protein
MAASSLQTYSAHCTGRPHGGLLHFHLSSQVREGESWVFFLSFCSCLKKYIYWNVELFVCLLVLHKFKWGIFFWGPQRIYLSPNAASMHLCLNFADAFMWANAESMPLIVELACLLLSSQNQCKTHLETISQIQLSTPNSGCWCFLSQSVSFFCWCFPSCGANAESIYSSVELACMLLLRHKFSMQKRKENHG